MAGLAPPEAARGLPASLLGLELADLSLLPHPLPSVHVCVQRSIKVLTNSVPGEDHLLVGRILIASSHGLSSVRALGKREKFNM